jgi:tRNA U34 5-methylaminomethyl-2-thiouridine-forming methyltransferase MnmC
MERKLLVTKDGSHTVSMEDRYVTYHSTHGAITESMHVFIRAGLLSLEGKEQISIFEMGFGTGLNALLTVLESQKSGQKMYYYSSELYPLEEELWSRLNYAQELKNADGESLFRRIHLCEWNTNCQLTSTFTLHKSNTDLIRLDPNQSFDLIYFDAFAPSAQPELWTEEVFRKMLAILNGGGRLVTYCSKGSVRRAMQAAGFLVEKLPGPPGKREIVRATKVSNRS